LIGSDGRDLADQSGQRKYLVLINFSVKATSQYDINVRHSLCDVNHVFHLNINFSRMVGQPEELQRSRFTPVLNVANKLENG
jgi:hypothetical protein